MDLHEEKLIHMNDHYQVVFIPEASRQIYKGTRGEDVIGNYEVRSRVYDTVEFGVDSLPLALSMAEHWNRILSTRSYLDDPFAELNELQLPFDLKKDTGSSGGLQ